MKDYPITTQYYGEHIPVFKPHTHKLYIFRHCNNIVYIS